jgi:phosphoglycerol geranylgeranyltransferase
MKLFRKRGRRKWVMKYINKRRKSGPLHFTLIDPDKQKPSEAAKLAQKAREFGTDAIMIGGSQAAQAIYLNDTIRAIKDKTDLPVILFPSSHSGVSPYADAVFFMSLLNSRSPAYLIDEQVKGAVLVKSYGIETLPMGYLIVESGNMTSVAWAGDVKPLPRDKPEFAVAYGLAAKYFGMRFVYLEAGSGAEKPVPNDTIAATREAVSGNGTIIIVGGGIRDEKTARDKVRSGADIIVTGTVAEDTLKGTGDPEALGKIIRAVKGKR